MNLIVAVTEDWGIGYKNQLLFHIGEDLKNFRQHTVGKVIVMGHNTFKSLPGAKPLPKRTHIVLSKDKTLKIPDVTVVHSVEDCLAHLKSYTAEDIYIIGGSQIYNSFLPHCTTAYITKIHQTRPCDTFFPNIDQQPAWQLTNQSEIKTDIDTPYQFCTYTKI